MVIQVHEMTDQWNGSGWSIAPLNAPALLQIVAPPSSNLRLVPNILEDDASVGGYEILELGGDALDAAEAGLADIAAGQATLKKFLKEGRQAFVSDAVHKSRQDEPDVRDSV
jgi:hypothetical protein